MEPQTNTAEHRFNEIIEEIIKCAYAVANTLANGFLERAYENALAHQLRKSSFLVEQQMGVKVRCDGIVTGDYMVGSLVQQEALVELRAVKPLDHIRVARC